MVASASSPIGLQDDPLVITLTEEGVGTSVDSREGLIGVEQFGRPDEHRHYINRLSFGPRKGEVAAASARSANDYIESQLSKTSADPAVEEMLGAFRYLNHALPRDVIEAVRADNDKYMYQARDLRKELTHSNFIRAVYSEHQLYEMMCQFWMDHFSIQLVDVGMFPLMAFYQEKAIRPNAMGSFRDLLTASANSPAMLQYLDNHLSNANSEEGVNENYGRELLELHTLGIHNDGSQVYSEADVYAASQAMAGWSVDYRRETPEWFKFNFHNPFSYSGQLSIMNGQWTSGNLTGKAVGDSLLEFLATHRSTAEYLAEKLIRRFVSEDNMPSLVASTAQVFLDNDTQIVPVLRHLAQSSEFADAWQTDNRKARKPFEAMVAMMRAADTQLDVDPRSEAAEKMAEHLDEMNHRPWHWPTPDGYPDKSASWLTTAGLVARFNLAAVLATGGSGYSVNVDHFRLTNGTVGELVQALANEFGMAERAADQVATFAQGIGLTPTDSVNGLSSGLLSRLAGLFFAHPDFQVR